MIFLGNFIVNIQKIHNTTDLFCYITYVDRYIQGNET